MADGARRGILKTAPKFKLDDSKGPFPKMYPALQQEIQTYEKRTPKSRAAHERAVYRVPLGVASNYRYYPPYPLFVRDGHGSRIHDLDGNEYIDHNL